MTMKYSDMKKAVEETGGVVDLTPTYHEFTEPGSEIVGRLKVISSVSSGFSEGTYNQYLMETDEGLIKCSLGSATDKEAGAMMKVGRIYIITSEGKEKISGGRTVNKFKVLEIDEAALPKEAR